MEFGIIILAFLTGIIVGMGGMYILRERRIGFLREKLIESETLRDAERNGRDNRGELLQEVEIQFENAFKALSAEALKSNNLSFMNLAKMAFEEMQKEAKGDLEHRQKAIKEMVSPIKQTLEKFDEKVNALEKNREGAYAGLHEQIKSLLRTQMKLEGETANLVKALRAPNVRGRWGEMQLRRTVELAGMINQVDFFEQESITTEDGRQRPDMIIHLPNGRKIVVDAKAPLTAYLEALETKDTEDQIKNLKNHARQIRDHLQKLGTKNYWKQFEPTPELVILFLPGEMFFSAALEQDPELVNFGANNKVMLATPTTLITLLKTVAYGWKQEGIALEMKEIYDLGNTLYERMLVFAEHFSEIRKGLEKSITAYNKAVGSIESRVFPTARKFKKLHSIGDKEIIKLQKIDQAINHAKVEEFEVYKEMP